MWVPVARRMVWPLAQLGLATRALWLGAKRFSSTYVYLKVAGEGDKESYVHFFPLTLRSLRGIVKAMQQTQNGFVTFSTFVTNSLAANRDVWWRIIMGNWFS